MPADRTAVDCLARLRADEATLATAESLTAGLVAATLGSVPGASDVLLGGMVAYAMRVKIDVLGVDPAVIEAYGAVSGECAAAMARAARSRFGASWAVSTTGVAGPTEQEGKPVGTVFVAVDGPAGVAVTGLRLTGSRDEIRSATVHAALTLLAEEHAARATQQPAVASVESP